MDLQELARDSVAMRAHLISGLRSPIMSDARMQRLAAAAASDASESEVVVWTQEMWNLASRGVDAFLDVTAPAHCFDSPVKRLWYCSDFRMQIPGTDGLVHAVMAVQSRELLAFTFFHLLSGQRLNVSLASLSPTEPIKPFIADYVARLAFMELKLAALEPVHLPRADRRRLQKAGQPVPEISIVHLRKREPSGWHTESEREYHNRWIVKGHWRRLHEPRKKDGATVTFVDSYVKGPDGAPLLPSREKVFAVTR